MRTSITRRPLVLPLVAALACAGSWNVAQAQEEGASPYYFGGGVSLTHDTNVFRASGSQPKSSDNITSINLLAGLDQPIGRQRVYGDVRLSNNRFQDNDDLNNNSYSARAGLDWSTIERLAGNVAVNVNQNLARFNPGDAPTINSKNIQRNESIVSSVRLGIVTRLAFTAAVGYQEVSFSAPQFDYREFSQNTVSAGVQYRFSGALTTGAALRHTEARYPRYRTTADGFQSDNVKRNDLDLTALWVASGASTINGRLSFGQSNHERAERQDFSGVTTLVSWNWRPTGRTRLQTQFSRETGQQTNFITFTDVPTESETDNSRLTNALQTRADYQLTGKITLNAGLRYADRSLTNTQQSGAPDLEGSDRTTALSFGARWAATRTASLGCSATRERRNASGTLSSPYSTGVYGCFAQIVLQ